MGPKKRLGRPLIECGPSNTVPLAVNIPSRRSTTKMTIKLTPENVTEELVYYEKTLTISKGNEEIKSPTIAEG